MLSIHSPAFLLKNCVLVICATSLACDYAIPSLVLTLTESVSETNFHMRYTTNSFNLNSVRITVGYVVELSHWGMTTIRDSRAIQSVCIISRGDY